MAHHYYSSSTLPVPGYSDSVYHDHSLSSQNSNAMLDPDPCLVDFFDHGHGSSSRFQNAPTTASFTENDFNPSDIWPDHQLTQDPFQIAPITNIDPQKLQGSHDAVDIDVSEATRGDYDSDYLKSSPDSPQIATPVEHSSNGPHPSHIHDPSFEIHIKSSESPSTLSGSLNPDNDNSEKCNDVSEPHTPYNIYLWRCFREAPGFERTLSDIYEWFKINVPKARNAEQPGWKNSVRHNLSLNHAFEKSSPGESKTSLKGKWRLKSEFLHHVYPTTRYRKDGNRNRRSGVSKFQNHTPAPQRQMSGALGGRAARCTRKQQRDEAIVQSQAFASLPPFVNSPFEMSTCHGLLPDIEYDYFKTQYSRAMKQRRYANETLDTGGSPYLANTVSTFPDSPNSSGYDNDDIFTVAPSTDAKHSYQSEYKNNTKWLPQGLGISNLASDFLAQYQATVAPSDLAEKYDPNLLPDHVGMIGGMDSPSTFDLDFDFNPSVHHKSAGLLNGMDSSPGFITNSSSQHQSTPQSTSSSLSTDENGQIPFSAQGSEICLNYSTCEVDVKPQNLVHAHAKAATGHQSL